MVGASRGFLAALVTAAALAILFPRPAHADFELQDSAGRRILLKDDGTWRYVDAQAPASAEVASAAASGPARDEPQAELRIAKRRDVPGGCAFELRLFNRLPVEIGTLVPDFRVFRSSDVVYAERNVGFGGLKPGDEQLRELRFEGLKCAEITKVQVAGGDRCEIGELNKFTDGKGLCLARIRVVPSELVAFEK